MPCGSQPSGRSPYRIAPSGSPPYRDKRPHGCSRSRAATEQDCRASTLAVLPNSHGYGPGHTRQAISSFNCSCYSPLVFRPSALSKALALNAIRLPSGCCRAKCKSVSQTSGSVWLNRSPLNRISRPFKLASRVLFLQVARILLTEKSAPRSAALGTPRMWLGQSSSANCGDGCPEAFRRCAVIVTSSFLRASDNGLKSLLAMSHLVLEGG